MELTTKNIIKILPFDNEFKESLMGSFDNLDPDQKFSIERVIWDLYDGLYELKLQENIRLEMEKSNDKDNPLTKGFYKKVKEKTEQDLLSEFVDTTISVDLSDARSKIDQILQKKSPATH